MENKFIIKNLSFGYGKQLILHRLNLQIKEGKITTILDPNGCGKSTLFQLLTKNITPLEGEIFFENNPLESVTMKEYAKLVAIVHQQNHAPGDITVERLVSFGRIPYASFQQQRQKVEDQKWVERAMKMTGVYQFKNRQIQDLSGGQRQRVWIAMALAQGTKTIILDEPTTYLDIRYQIQILKLVKLLNRKFGLTIIMVLHDINQAIAYSDEIIALSGKGEVVAVGVPEKIINSDTLYKIYGISLETINYGDRQIILI